MCWGRSRLLCTQAQKNPMLTDAMWTFTTAVFCLGAQMHKTTKLQRSRRYKTAAAWKEKMWLRCSSMEALCISIYFLCCFNHIIKNEKEMLTQSKESLTEQITGSRCTEVYAGQYLHSCAYVKLYMHVPMNAFWTHDVMWQVICLDITFFLRKQNPLWLIPQCKIPPLLKRDPNKCKGETK